MSWLSFSKAMALIAYAIVFIVTFTAAEAKDKNKSPPNFPWQSTEWLTDPGKPDSYRMGYIDNTTGGSYAIYPDGTASITLDNGGWDISCKKDPIDDERKCFIRNDTLRIGVFYGENREPKFLKVLEHDFPGKRATLRIDKGKAITSDTDGVIDGSVVAQLVDAKSVTTRVYIWPYDKANDETKTNASGYAEAVALLHHLQDHIEEMSFK